MAIVIRSGLLSLIACICVLSSSEVAARVKWLEKEYNFGVIKEGDGMVTGRVRMVNEGSEATFIGRVRPSCGCTGATYTSGSIEPGDTATITFTYNPLGRPGKFDKTIKVFTGKDNDLTVIRITGTVVGSEATLASAYPVECGSLRLESKIVAGGEIKRGSSRHLFLNAYNQGADSIRPTWVCKSPHLSVDVAPRTIPPGDIATFGFYLRTDGVETSGPIEIPVRINAGENSKDYITLTVNAVIVPDTRNMSVEELEKGGRAYLVPEFVDFGEVAGKGGKDFVFEILNEGESDLKVDRVFSRSGKVTLTSVPKKVKPGKKGKVKGRLDIGALPEGAFRVNVEVVTNDVIHPVRVANLVGIKK